MRPLVVAMAGTDHHRFDRLVDWLDDVARRHPEVDVVVQHGTSRAPVVARGHDYLPHGRLRDLLGRASVVVTHGGPASIMDARQLGHVPLCVPRDPGLAEHVDDHQLRFATLVGQAGVVRTVTDLDRLHTVLDELLSLGDSPRSVGAPVTPATEQARTRLYAELDALAGGSRAAAGRTGRRGSSAGRGLRPGDTAA